MDRNQMFSYRETYFMVDSVFVGMTACRKHLTVKPTSVQEAPWKESATAAVMNKTVVEGACGCGRPRTA